MKRAKIISAISLMILCVCMLSIGVISANSVSDKMSMGGTIVVPQNKIGVVVKGYIIQGIVEEIDYSKNRTADFDSSMTVEDGESDSNKDSNGEYITCFGDTWNFTQKHLEKMTFDLSGANTELDFEKAESKVTIVFVITDNSQGSIDLEAYFSKLIDDKNEKITSDILQSAEEKIISGETVIEKKETVSVSLGTSTIEGEAIETKISITFTPMRFVESKTELNFSYKLNIAEKTISQITYQYNTFLLV